MTSPNRARAAALALAGLLTFAAPDPAQAIVCTNCATEITQLLNNLQLVDQLTQQIEQVRLKTLQLENMLRNSKTLEKQKFEDAVSDIKQLNQLLAKAKALSFASANIAAQFSAKYKDFNGYLAEQPGGNDIARKLQQWSEDTNSSVLTTLEAAALTNQQIEGRENEHLQSLEKEATEIEGQMEALQNGNRIALAAVRQMQKQRHLTTILMTLLANYIARQADREATMDAGWRTFSKFKPVPTND